ncbi:MAG: hypothetical protein WDN49_05730 [Acetobacteraceae bacterium]
MNWQSPLFQVEQSAGAAKVMQNMSIDVKEKCPVPEVVNHMAVPDLVE